jgi:excisionase family DNA binding protein
MPREIAANPERMNEVSDGSITGWAQRIPVERIPSVLTLLSARLIQEMACVERREQNLGTPNSEELLTASQLGKRLNVPESWVRSEQRADRIPSVRLGRYVRFRPSEVDAALARRTNSR